MLSISWLRKRRNRRNRNLRRWKYIWWTGMPARLFRKFTRLVLLKCLARVYELWCKSSFYCFLCNLKLLLSMRWWHYCRRWALRWRFHLRRRNLRFGWKYRLLWELHWQLQRLVLRELRYRRRPWERPRNWMLHLLLRWNSGRVRLLGLRYHNWGMWWRQSCWRGWMWQLMLKRKYCDNWW